MGVLISVLGLTSSAQSQIDSRFTDLAATEVTVSQSADPVSVRSLAFPIDFEDRVRRITGVRDAGLAWNVSPERASVDVSVVPGAGQSAGSQVPVVAASPSALRVARARAGTGRLYDGFAQANSAAVALLGPAAAGSLGITSLSGQPTVSVGGTAFAVIGLLDDVQRHPELLSSVIVPTSSARSRWGDPGAGDVSGWVEVERGAGRVVASQLPSAISASAPDAFEIVPPPDPEVLRSGVSEDLRGLFLVLAGICMLVGMVGIANTTFVTVMERQGEIGLRRALGARRLHIATQFLVEAAVIGLIGGLVGALAGLSVVVTIALFSGWTAVVPPVLVPLGPAIGAATALVAATYPALRAATTEPVAALRSGT